jgi:uncharacterized damage-inducible protein DinB
MQSLLRLFNHMEWADLRTLDALRSLREPPSQAVDLLAHMLAAEHVWLRRVQQRTPAYEIWPKLNLEECERLSRANHLGFRELLGGKDDMSLDHPVTYSNSSGRTFDTHLRDILLHITHHGMYHRGQVALLVRAAGGTPLATDFIAFVRE